MALPFHEDALLLVGLGVHEDLRAADGLEQLDDVDLVKVSKDTVHEKAVVSVGR